MHRNTNWQHILWSDGIISYVLVGFCQSTQLHLIQYYSNKSSTFFFLEQKLFLSEADICSIWSRFFLPAAEIWSLYRRIFFLSGAEFFSFWSRIYFLKQNSLGETFSSLAEMFFSFFRFYLEENVSMNHFMIGAVL